MLAYAGRCLASRRSLWAVSAACALLVALPGALFATVLAPSLVALLLSGDLLLAARLLPGGIGEEAFSALWWAGMSAVLLAGIALWSRLYATAVWLSKEENPAGGRAAWAATRRSWRSVFVLYLEANLGIAAVAVALIVASGVAGQGAAGLASLLFVTAAMILVLRTLVRVALTLAVRAAVFDGVRGRSAWRTARTMMREERRRAFAAWVTLVALGASLWIVGRLVSPILQDTALDYPHDSTYALGREAAQLLVAVPIEGFLIALSLGVWTAVFLGVEEPERRPDQREGRRNPWIVRGLALLALIALVGNGIPTMVDTAWTRASEERERAIDRREIEPIDVLGTPRPAQAPAAGTSYRVHAELDEARLEWTTRITYNNGTGEDLYDVGVNVYAAAYTRPVTEIPLGRDLLASDLSGAFRSQAEPGTFRVANVTVDGRGIEPDLDDTAMTVRLPEPLQPNRNVKVEIALSATLPQWPTRFGVWDDMTLLGNWIPTVAVREEGEWRLDPFTAIGDPFYSEIADYAVDIETDDRQAVVGTGTLTRIQGEEGGRRSWHFEASRSRDAAFAVAPFLRGLEQSLEGTTVRAWYQSDNRVAGQGIAHAAASAVADYRDRFGPLPFDEVEVVLTDGPLGGMEYPGVIFQSADNELLSGVPLVPDLMSAAGFADAEARYVAGHEIAHQWWYATVGNDQIEEPWLDEALAEVSTRLWLRSEDGEDRVWRTVNLRSDADPEPGVLTAGIEDFGSNSGYAESVYLGGSEVLLELRRRIGAERFDRLLRTWYAEQSLSIGTVNEFVATTRRVAGDPAADYLELFVSG